MAKKQYEGPDTHVSTDQTTGDVPQVQSGTGPFPKYVFVFVKEGTEVKSILVNSQEELDAIPAGWAESPADHEAPKPVVEEAKAE